MCKGRERAKTGRNVRTCLMNAPHCNSTPKRSGVYNKSKILGVAFTESGCLHEEGTCSAARILRCFTNPPQARKTLYIRCTFEGTASRVRFRYQMKIVYSLEHSLLTKTY